MRFHCRPSSTTAAPRRPLRSSNTKRSSTSGDVDVVIGVRAPRDRAAVHDRTEAHRRRLEMPVVAPVGDEVAGGAALAADARGVEQVGHARCRYDRPASPTPTCPARPRTAPRRRRGAACSRRSPTARSMSTPSWSSSVRTAGSRCGRARRRARAAPRRSSTRAPRDRGARRRAPGACARCRPSSAPRTRRRRAVRTMRRQVVDVHALLADARDQLLAARRARGRRSRRSSR